MFRFAIVAVCVGATAAFAYSQTPAEPLMQATAPAASPPALAKPVPGDPFGRDTPRGCVLGLLKAVERGDYTEAVQYLDVPVDSPQSKDLARRLQAALNNGLHGNIDDLSKLPEGKAKDSLRNGRDLVGFVDTPSGRVNIFLDRIQRGANPPIWLFAAETLNRLPALKDGSNTPAILRFLPRAFAEIKIFTLPLWRWLIISISIAIALLSATLLTRSLMPVIRPILQRVAGHEGDEELVRLRGPFQLIMLALALRLLAQFSLSLLAHSLWNHLSDALAIAGFGWLIIQFSDVFSELRSKQLLCKQQTSHIAILAVVHRLFKILVIFVAIVILLQGAGVNVRAMLAGLGIGGIALAFAAQKTLEDLFGGIAIITRDTLRVGDFCRLAEQMGTIEDVGLGSTRVRTLDDTVLTIPNAKVSQMSLENFSMRRKIWFHHVFGVHFETPAKQLRDVLTSVTEILRADTQVEAQSARIRLIGFGTSSLNLEIFAYVKESDYGAFLAIQEKLLFEVMEAITTCGVQIALPSQTSYLARGPKSYAVQEPTG